MLPLRIISAILLVFALFTLSGVTTVAAALLHVENETTYCDEDRDAGQSVPAPCSVPDCPCFFCINLIPASFPTVLRTSPGEISLYSYRQSLHLSEYVSSIDYPPENA
jgi:hypothetical protein